MKNTMKILCVCILVLFAVACVSACGITVTQNTPTDAPAPAATTAPAVQSTPVSDVSFLVTDNLNWGTMYFYAWGSDYNYVGAEWPGTVLTEKTYNDRGELQFKCYVPDGAIGVLVHDGNGSQTVDITDFTSYDGYWLDGTTDDKGHYHAIGWNYGESANNQSNNAGSSDVDEMMDYAVNNSFSKGFCDEINRSDLFSMTMYAEDNFVVWDLTFKTALSDTEKEYYLQKFKESDLTENLAKIREVVEDRYGRSDFGMIVRYRTIDGVKILEQSAY